MSSDKKIIVLSSNHRVKNEVDIFKVLFDEGLTHLHIRKHGFPEEKVEKIIKAIPSQYHKQIILHSHYALSKKYDLGGIHITRKKRKDKMFMFWNLPKYRKAGDLMITTSFHSTRKIEKSPSYYSYLFLNSLFGSIKEKGKHSYKDKEKLEEFLRLTNKEIVAMGGIDKVNIQEVKDIGFKAIGLHGAVWGFDDPVKRFKKLRDLWI